MLRFDIFRTSLLLHVVFILPRGPKLQLPLLAEFFFPLQLQHLILDGILKPLLLPQPEFLPILLRGEHPLLLTL